MYQVPRVQTVISVYHVRVAAPYCLLSSNDSSIFPLIASAYHSNFQSSDRAKAFLVRPAKGTVSAV